MKKFLFCLISLLIGTMLIFLFGLYLNQDLATISKKNHKLTRNLISKHPVTENKSFVVVIASYNNENVAEKNLFSVFEQTYKNYRVIYIDDGSQDNTYKKAKDFIEARGEEKRVSLYKNEQRKLKLSNLYKAYTSCKDSEIIVCLDGDDWLGHENVLKELNDYYQNPEVWITYSRAINHPNYNQKSGAPLTDKILLNNEIRTTPYCISMLRTFYAGLFKKIKLKDLMYQGKFLPSADDFAMMIPMIEMAPTHTLFIPEILYIINENNPIRENSIIESLQIKLRRSLKIKEKYKPLDITFNPRDLKAHSLENLVDLVIFSNNTPELLSKNLSHFLSMLISTNHTYIYYKATTESKHRTYHDLISAHPNITFILDTELEFKKFIENCSPYIALMTDDFSFTKQLNLLDCTKQLELTSSVNFFISEIPKEINRLELNESIIALSLDTLIKNPQLFPDSFFIISQKKFLERSLDGENPFKNLYKSLCVKEENLTETALFLNTPL